MHVYLDDSGDPGVKFGHGSTQHLVMAACVFNSNEAMESASRAIRDCRKRVHRSERWEFKYAKTSDYAKDEFFSAIAPLDFKVRAIVIDKRDLYSGHLRSAPKHLQNYAIKELLTHTLNTVQDAKLVIDGGDRRAFGVKDSVYFRKYVNEVCPGTIRDVSFADSSRVVLIQLADMVAGAIHRSQRADRNGAEHHMRVVRAKTKYPEGNVWHFK